jgi:long-chain acyl-CoA synthetase
VAVIELEQGIEEKGERFMKYCRENLPDSKVPHKIRFRKEIPKNPAGKHLRRVLREEM